MIFQSREENTVVGSIRHVWLWTQRELAPNQKECGECVSNLEASLDVRMIANCM